MAGFFAAVFESCGSMRTIPACLYSVSQAGHNNNLTNTESVTHGWDKSGWSLIIQIGINTCNKQEKQNPF